MRTGSDLMIAAAVLAITGAAHVATAATIATASFDAADGFTLGQLDTTSGGNDGQTGGTGWLATDTWTVNTDITKVNVVDVSASPLSYSVPGGGIVSGGAQALQLKNAMFNTDLLNRDLASSQSGDAVYIGFLYRNVVKSGDSGVAAEKLTFYIGSTATMIGLDDNPGGQFMVRLASGESNEIHPTGLGAVTEATDYFIVGKLSKTTPGTANAYNRFDLWVNPSSTEDAPLATATLSTGGASSFTKIGMIGYGAENPTGADGDVNLFDQLTLGSEWADVVPVPEPTSLGLVAMGAMALLGRCRKRQ